MREIKSKIKKQGLKILNNSPSLRFYVMALNSRQAGFTLLEVMIALAITGGLLITLIYTLNYHLGIAEKHEAVTVATFLAKGKVAELEASPQKKDGVFPPPYSDYSYATDVRQSSAYGMSEITVSVRKGKEVIRLGKLIAK